MTMLKLRIITVRGTPYEMGLAHGTLLQDKIQAFVAMRFAAVKEYLAALGHTDVSPLVDIGRKAMEIYEDWHPDGFSEHCAIAKGAGVDPVDLYTAANMTDLRDVLTLSSPVADSEGCSALLLPPGWTGQRTIIAAQTWDLNPQDIDYVVGIRREPEDGPATFSVTCSGCLTLVGMSANGLTVGTTNIKTQGSRIGLGYMSILYKMLNSPDFDAAAQVCETAPRAAAHTYWLADPTRAAEWEATGFSAVRRDMGEDFLVRTNHCQVPEHVRVQAEPPSASSLARLARMSGVLGKHRLHTFRAVAALFADRSDGVNSVNRRAEDNQGTATNSCFIGFPEKRMMWVCRGSSDQGSWIPIRL